MYSMQCCTGRLIVPLLRSQLASHEVKLVIGHSPKSLQTSFSTSPKRPFINVHQCQRSPLQVINRTKGIPQPGVLLYRSAGTLSLRTLLTSSQNLVTRGGAQQLRSIQLPLRQSGDNEWEELKKLSIYQRLKILLKKYWYIAIPLHLANSAAWFGGLYLLAKFGIDGAKVIGMIQPYILESEYVHESVKDVFRKDPATLGELAVALLLYKVTTPARYLATIFGTFYMVRFLLRTGVLVKSSTEISTMVKNSYLTHAVNQNLQKRIKALKLEKLLKKRVIKKPKSH